MYIQLLSPPPAPKKIRRQQPLINNIDVEHLPIRELDFDLPDNFEINVTPRMPSPVARSLFRFIYAPAYNITPRDNQL